MINRRRFIATLSTLGAAAAAAPAWARRLLQSAELPVRELRGGAKAFLGDGGIVLGQPSEAGPLLIDAKFAHTAGLLARQSREVLGAAPTLLIDTHHHADHSGGNWAFTKDATIIAHQNLSPRLAGNLPAYRSRAEADLAERRRRGDSEADLRAAAEQLETIAALTVADFAPDREVAGELVLDHGGVKIELRHFGPGHTDNDLVVFLPQANILHLGDLLFHELHPFIDRSARASTIGWQNSLREAMKLGDSKTIVIPGHGEIADMSALPKMIDYFDQLRGIVTDAIRAGTPRDVVAAMKPEAFRGRGFEQLQARALEAMYDEISEEQH